MSSDPLPLALDASLLSFSILDESFLYISFEFEAFILLPIPKPGIAESSSYLLEADGLGCMVFSSDMSPWLSNL